MDSWISGKLVKGDLVFACFGGSGEIGFYLGGGKGNSQQYYSIYRLANWFNRNKDLDHLFTTTRPYRSYISNSNKYRFIKYSPELIINQEQLETYNTAVEALKLLNI